MSTPATTTPASTTGSFPASTTPVPETRSNPFNDSGWTPPAPTGPDGGARETRDPITREPVRTEPPTQTTTPPAQTQQTQPQQQTTTPPAGQQVVMTDAQLAELANRMRPQAAPVAPQAQPQMTDEEFAKQFNIHRVTEQEYEAILGIKPDNPSRVAALDAALQAISRQSVTIMRHLMEERARGLEQQIVPVRQDVLHRQMQQHYQDFVRENTDLKDYGPLLQEIVTSSKAKIDAGQMPPFANAAEARKFVAQQARVLLRLPANPGQSQQTQQTTPAAGTQGAGSRQMSTTSMGGRTGQSGGAAPTKGLAEKLFEEQAT